MKFLGMGIAETSTDSGSRRAEPATNPDFEGVDLRYAWNMDLELDELTEVYLRHHATNDDEDFWAYNEVYERVRAGFGEAWEVVQSLVEKADAGTQLGYVAAGPVEDFVDRYGDSALDVIETACETDQKMQLVLSGIWLLPESPVLMRWRDLMKKYGFMGGTRKPLSTHPDCWF